MNFAVFVPPPTSAHPQRPFYLPQELQQVGELRRLRLDDLSRQSLPLDLHVSSTTIENDYVVYHVTIESTVTKHQWNVSYRFSELLAFKNKVKELYTCHGHKCTGSCEAIRDYLSECFPKRRLIGSTSSRAIKERTQKFENVLLHLLRCVLLPGSAMKCMKARRVLPRALFEFLGVQDELDRRSLLQIYVDNHNCTQSHSKSFSSSRTSTSSDFHDDDDSVIVWGCHSFASTVDFEQEQCHEDGQCMICLEDLDDEACACEDSAQSTVTLPCNHSFHRECVFEWLLFEFHCPLCRTRVGPHAVTNYCRPKNSVQWWLGEFDEDPLAKSD